MRITLGAAAAISLLFFSLAGVMRADTVTASIGCATAANALQGMDTTCNAPGGGPAMIDTSGSYSSTGILVTLTSITGLVITPSGEPILEDLDPTAPEQWTFAFSDGNFTITDADSDFLTNGTYTITGTGTNSVTLGLIPTTVTFATDDLSVSLVQDAPGASGSATINYTADPVVTGVSIGTEFPSLVPAPEPSTTWLLLLGLAGIGLLTRRRLTA